MNDELAALLLGGIIGVGISRPKPAEKEVTNNYYALLQSFEERKKGLGRFEISDGLLADQQVYTVLEESFKMYIYKFNKGSSLLCIALLESKLRDLYGLKNFEDLIKKANEENFLSNRDVHFLNGLRVDRNFIVHNIFEEISDNDAQITFKLVVRLLNNIYK